MYVGHAPPFLSKQCNEYKRETEKLQCENTALKRKYYALARREALAKEKELEFLAELAPAAPKPVHKTRYVGGGFAVK